MRRIWLMAIGLAVMISIAACGAKTETVAKPASGNEASNMITVEGLNWKFNQAEYKVKAGEPITITYKNKEGVHGIIIKDLNVDLTNGKSVSVTAEKGMYEIICSIPCGSSKQHTEMRAMLIVE